MADQLRTAGKHDNSKTGNDVRAAAHFHKARLFYANNRKLYILWNLSAVQTLHVST